jgi:hypothetical protein
VLREYAARYGEKVKGWWVDGCYQVHGNFGYGDETLGMLARALKGGNPNCIIGMNNGVEDRVRPYTRHEDFTCGEQNEFKDVPEGRWVNGEQWHILSFLGCSHQGWAVPGSKYKKQEIAEYVRKVNERDGVVSIDVMLYRDGGLDRSQLEMLKAVRPKT